LWWLSNISGAIQFSLPTFGPAMDRAAVSVLRMRALPKSHSFATDNDAST